MPSIKNLYSRRCVEGLIRVIEQVPCRLAARPSLGLSDSSMATLVLWTLLRWERTFLLIALEDMWVDMWGLTRDVDALLNQEQAKAVSGEGHAAALAASSPSSPPELDRYLIDLLDRAEIEAVALGHEYLGTEHLLLAIIAGAHARLSSVLLRHNITHENVKLAVVELLKRAPAVEDRTEPARSVGSPAGARRDREAVGVPRRFGTAVLMLLVTMYAVLFATMQLLDLHPIVFITVAVLFTGVGLGQMLLYRGKYPRAASVWTGACLFPFEVLVVLLWVIFFPSTQFHSAALVPWLVLLLVVSPPVGAGFGYLAGGLTAGVFLLIERYKKYREARSAARDDREPDALAAATAGGPIPDRPSPDRSDRSGSPWQD